jgi:ABC-type Zn uptake system ZnuABC Zn-binding protein ZnuA
MKVTTRGVQQFAREAGLPEELIARHAKALETFTFRVAKRQRKIDQNKIRAWYFEKNLNKSPLFKVLEQDDVEDLI